MLRSKRVTSLQAAPNAPWVWAFGGLVVGLLLATVLNAPAHWLTSALQQSAQGRVLLDEPHGTIWNGSTRLTLTGGAGSSDAATLPGRTSWKIQLGWRSLGVNLQADCCMQQAWQLRVLPHWGGAQVSLTDSFSQWPAQWLTGLGTPWNTIQARGPLVLTTQALVVDWTQGRVSVQGKARLDAVKISTRLSTLSPMGSYRINFQGGDAPNFALETLEGSLQLTGSGQWVGSRLRFEGVASAVPERLDALSNLLNIIGRRDGARAIIKVG